MNEPRPADVADVARTDGSRRRATPGPFASFIRFVVCGEARASSRAPRYPSSPESDAVFLAVTTVVVLAPHVVQPEARGLPEQVVYLGAAALAGMSARRLGDLCRASPRPLFLR